MAKRKQDVDFDENVIEEEVLEGADAAPKKKRQPSRKTLLTNEITDFIRSNENKLPDELVELVKQLDTVPSRARGEGKPSIASQIKAIMLDPDANGRVHEDVFYEKFKVGRLEMKRRFYNAHKKVSDPAERIYVKGELQDDDSMVYVLVGQGAEVPEGFES
jgi:hypothetical protein